MLKKIISGIVKNIRLFNGILSNFFNNYILAYIDRYTIHNDLGASFTSIVRDRKTIVKKATPDGEDKLADEINWYIKLKNSKIRKWFPKIVDYSVKKGDVYYRMKYYNYPNLRKIIMYNGNAFFVLKLRWKKIFSIYNKYLFTKKNSSKPSQTFVNDCHLEKLKSRVQSIKKKLLILLLY